MFDGRFSVLNKTPSLRQNFQCGRILVVSSQCSVATGEITTMLSVN